MSEVPAELVNTDPYGQGWIIDIDIAADASLDDLLDAATYGTLAS